MLFFGKTADLLGCRSQLISGLSSLSLLSLMLAVSPNPIFLIIFCGLLGLGIAAAVPPAIESFLRSYSQYPTRKIIVLGYLGAGNPLGFILGSILSGIATRLFSWRAAFVMMSIVYFFIALLAMWTVPRSFSIGNKGQVLKTFDYAGIFLIVAGMTLLSAALT